MTQSYSKDDQRRIFNTIWSASEDYDYIPDFIASNISGNPDFYFNIIIGLAYKYYGKENIDILFSSWQNSIKQDQYDYICWLSLENILYQKEVSKRPVLSILRKEYAKNFFDDKFDLQRRNFALKNQILFVFQSQRMKEILGMKNESMDKKQRIIYDSLIFDKDVDFLSFKNKLLHVYKKYLKFDSEKNKSYFSKFLKNSFKKTSFQPLERSIKPSYLFSESNDKKSNTISSPYINIWARYSKAKEEKIENSFGKSIYDKERLAQIEKICCENNHKKSKLWFTKGQIDRLSKDSGLSQVEKIAIQKNKQKFNKNKNLYNRQINEIKRKIQSSLNSTQSFDTSISNHGNLIGRLAYKSKLPNEDNIFQIKTDQIQSNLSVDILLDGSASLMDYQQDIAIQAYILATSLKECDIKSRISAYCSVENYTVISILKDFDQKVSKESIFKYHSRGWNRDGLAYRAFNELLKEKISPNHLLIIMSDVCPRDLKPFYNKTFGFNKAYEGVDALEDAKNEIDKIRKTCVKVSAIINSRQGDDKDLLLKNSKYLFRDNFAKINSIANFSNAASRLIKKEISKLNMA